MKKIIGVVKQFVFIIFYIISINIHKFLSGVKIKNNYINYKPKKGPVFILANHNSLFDGYYILGEYKTKPLSFLTTDPESGILGSIARFVGNVTKKVDTPDMESIMNIMRKIKDGYSVCIFPEGDMSWDGETTDFNINLINFIKKMKVPIVLIKFNGCYMINPRWAKYRRRGMINKFRHTLDVDYIKKTSAEQLYKDISGFLYCNDIKETNIMGCEYRGKKVAEGIGKLLWKCPKCGTYDSITGIGNDIICSNCNSKWELNANQIINPKEKNINDLKDWMEWQKKDLFNLVHNKDIEILIQKDNIDLYINKVDKNNFYSKGTLKLYRDKIILNTDKKDKEDIIIDINKIYLTPLNMDNILFITYEDGKRICLKFKESNGLKFKLMLQKLKKLQI